MSLLRAGACAEALMRSLGQDPTPAELEKMVALADADGSGDIDFCEFATLIAHKMKDEESESKSDRITAAFGVFVRAAARARGCRLRRPRQLSSRTPLACDGWRLAHAPQDHDKSGQIDAQEMRRIMINLGEKMSIEQVDEILGYFDDDGDGMISPQEFAKALTEHKRFGTQAVQ